jgi:endonuclease/exonuclease/phosphatase family metal-dependent hydrolase
MKKHSVRTHKRDQRFELFDAFKKQRSMNDHGRTLHKAAGNIDRIFVRN